MFTKDEMIKAGAAGGFLNTDGIQYDLDGASLAEHIKSLGADVCGHEDTGRYGVVVFSLNDTLYTMSTNGYVRQATSADYSLDGR